MWSICFSHPGFRRFEGVPGLWSWGPRRCSLVGGEWKKGKWAALAFPGTLAPPLMHMQMRPLR